MTTSSVAPKPGDLLLAWLSAKGRVSRPTVERACRAIARRFHPEFGDVRSSIHRLISPLTRIGHVEAVRGGYVVTPPTLCWTARSGAGMFIGARDQTLFRELVRRLGPRFVEEDPDGPWPSNWRATGDRAAIAEALAGLEIEIVEESGMRLLASLPTLEEAIVALNDAAPPSSEVRWEILEHQKGPSRWRWGLTDTLLVDDGLVRRRVDRGPKTWTIRRLGAWRRIDSSEKRAVAGWAELARQARPPLRYERGAARLSLPSCFLPPPLMVERPLIWASGTPPSGTSRRGLIHDAIEPERAEQVARILGLSLEIIE